MRSNEPLVLERQPRYKRIRGFHGFACPKCQTGVGFNARQCRRCGTAVGKTEVVVDTHSEDSIRLQQGDVDEPNSTEFSPPNFATALKEDSDSEGTAVVGRAPSQRAMYSKPAAYERQKLVSGGYGYHGGSPYTHSSPPPAKRQAIARRPKAPRRPLPRIPTEGGSSLLTPFSGMPRAGVREHTVSLRLEHIQKTLRPLLLRFMQHTCNRNVFNEPVDRKIPNYYETIKFPMDFGTVKTNLQGLGYHSTDAFAHDMRLVFANAMVYYSPSQDLHAAASTMSAEFEAEYDKLVKKAERGNQKKGEHACSLCQGETCALCGAKCLKYEPPAIVCDGPCAQRLRRGATFYITHDGTRLWCQKCHSGLNSVLPPPDGTDGMSEYMDPSEREKAGDTMPPPSLLYKRDLLRRKFDEEIAEPWVQCDSCQRWVHQTCAAFNERSNATPAGEGARFCCPECEGNCKVPPMRINIKVCGQSVTVLDARPQKKDDAASCASGAASVGSMGPNTSTQLMDKPKSQRNWWSAEDLPQCHMSRFIEAKCNQRMAELLDLGPVSEGNYAALGDKKVIIRVVSALESQCEVNYAVRKYFHAPRFLPYRSKSLMMFQKVDGIDVCLWCMYVQEYGANCAQPSTRRVYIAYLDSVEYFRPRHVRSAVYHEILVSYLAWVAARGFTHAHIWACPPYRGNNFIFWCHPSHQRTPSGERLVQWYRTMLERGKAVGAIGAVKNLYEASFEKFSMDPKDWKLKQDKEPEWDPMDDKAEEGTCPPIFDGDMWMDEVVVVNRRFVARKDQLAEGGHSTHEGCLLMLKKLMKHPSAYPFNTPVDTVTLKIPQYAKIISTPMDLGTVKAKLSNHEYPTLRPLVFDVRLTFLNAKEFNPPKHPVNTMAASLLSMFDKEIRFFLAKWQHLIPRGEDLFSLVLSTPEDMSKSMTKEAASECSSAPPAPITFRDEQEGARVEGSQGDCDAVTTKEKEISTSGKDPSSAVTCSMSTTISDEVQDQPSSQSAIERDIEHRVADSEAFRDSATETIKENGLFDTKSTVDTPQSVPVSNDTTVNSSGHTDQVAPVTSSAIEVITTGLPLATAPAVGGLLPTAPGGSLALPINGHLPQVPMLRSDPGMTMYQPQNGLSMSGALSNMLSQSPALAINSPGLSRPPAPTEPPPLQPLQAGYRPTPPLPGLQPGSISPRLSTANSSHLIPPASQNRGMSPTYQQSGIPHNGIPRGPATGSPMYAQTNFQQGSGMNHHSANPRARTPRTPGYAYDPPSTKGNPDHHYRDQHSGHDQEGSSNWNLPPPRKLDWAFVHPGPDYAGGKVRLKFTYRARRPPVVDGISAQDIVLPPPRKVPSIAAEYKLPLPAQVAKTIEKMKNDFFVVQLCPPGTDCPEGRLNLEELPKHGVEHGPSSGAGRRRKAATKKKARKINEEKADKIGKTKKVKKGRDDDVSELPPGTDMYGLPLEEETKVHQAFLSKEELRLPDADPDGSQATGSQARSMATLGGHHTVKSEATAGAYEASVKCELTSMDVDDQNNAAADMPGGAPFEATEAIFMKKEGASEPSGRILFANNLELNATLDAYMQCAPVPDTALMEDTKDPDGLFSTPYVDSRHTFLEMCQWRHYQFDTLRRAKHASLLSLYHLHNCTLEDNKAHAAHCAECGKQIKGVRWHCSVCPDFELCSTCNTHDPNNPTLHPHLLTPYRVSYEGELRA